MQFFEDIYEEYSENIVVYVFILVVAVQTIYPMTIGDSPSSLLVYNIMYGLLMISGVLVARDSPRLMRFTIVVGILWFILGFIVSFFYPPNQLNFIYIPSFILIGLLQFVVMKVLFTYIFNAQAVTRNVLLAAIANYWLLGGFFAVIFGILEAGTFLSTGQNAFIDGSIGVTGSITPWQSTLYYSYATLTTLGYGDVLPVSAWARSIVSVEAIVGVMYTTIIMARLVSVFVSTSDAEILKEFVQPANEQ